jgi:transposase
VSFVWKTSRAARCLDHIIPADFNGTVQCDGYSAYPSFANRSDGRITLAACWAHARRKFFEAKDSAPQHAGWLLLQIQHLYRIEKHLRETKAGPAQRQAVRTSQSRMITLRIHRALTRMKLSRRHLPQSALGKAIDYTLTLWPLLLVYLEDGRIEIDNNLVENAIRPTAVGKKNWLFIGEAEAGDRSAIFFTLIEACRSRGIDPQTYLREVLTRLPTMTNRQIKDVTPEAWAKAHTARTQRKAA